MTSPLVIRRAEPRDERRWRLMWDAYCVFYDVDVPADATAGTWSRILDPGSPINAIVAERDGDVIGFANYLVHEYTWGLRPICYLEDLFVEPAARGSGVGRALIDWLLAEMRAKGWARLYWHTDETNKRAQALYDSYTPHSGVLRYAINNPNL